MDDIKTMEKKATGSYRGIDGYIRYITDEAKKYFDISVMTNIRINSETIRKNYIA